MTTVNDTLPVTSATTNNNDINSTLVGSTKPVDSVSPPSSSSLPAVTTITTTSISAEGSEQQVIDSPSALSISKAISMSVSNQETALVEEDSNLTLEQQLLALNQKEIIAKAEESGSEEDEVEYRASSTEPPRVFTEKENAAATAIQSVFRGYQARREMEASPLKTSKSWKQLIDYSRQELIHKTDATARPLDPSSRARLAWRRAEFLSSRVGKGASRSSENFANNENSTTTTSTDTDTTDTTPTTTNLPGRTNTEEALMLLTEHWLELSDKNHRYGSNLKPYHALWMEQDHCDQSFFYWLDYGDGKNVDLEERPRSRLEQQKVQYLKENERENYAIKVIDGLMYYRVSGKLVHTLPETVGAHSDVDLNQVLPDADDQDSEQVRLEKKRIRNKCKYIYVTDSQGTLYVGQKSKGQFHHSSFLSGATVCAAGGIVINHGKLIKINPKSGHYRPGQVHFDRLLSNLKIMGISLEGVKVSSGILETGPVPEKPE